MKISFDNRLAERYKSFPQKIRVLTEGWVDNEVFCPACGRDIKHYENNRPVADFVCLNKVKEVYGEDWAKPFTELYKNGSCENGKGKES